MWMKTALPPKFSYTVPTAAFVADTSETSVWDTIGRGDVSSFIFGRRRMILAEVWHNYLRELAASQVDGVKSGIGAAGRAALAAKREQAREAALAAAEPEPEPPSRRGRSTAPVRARRHARNLTTAA
jgi:hypothetical protein